MLYHYLPKKRADQIRRFLSATLIVAVLGLGAPAQIVIADDTTTDASSTPAITVDQSTPPADEAPQETPSATTNDETTPTETEASVPSPSTEVSTTTVTTGDAMSEADVITTVNTNTVETEPAEDASSTPPSTTETDTVSIDKSASTTPATLVEKTETLPLTDEATSEESVDEATSGETDVTNENEADVENTVETEAQTGDNAVESNGSANISTGNAFSGANIINVVNTNTLNSSGLLLLLNNFFNTSGDLDLRDMYFPSVGSDSTTDVKTQNAPSNNDCYTDTCGIGTTIATENTNSASITNDVVVRAQTGGNSATGTDASINTGDAYAAANVVNIANTNIVDSNYLVLEVNDFNNWFGDLVLPSRNALGKAFGFGGEKNNDEPGSAASNVTNENSATIENTISTNASTGGNEADAASSTADITTGGANATANVTNVVNQNMFNSDSFMVIFRIYGNWAGSVFGAPKGLSWEETPNGVVLFNDSAGGATNPASHTADSVQNDNSAAISNNINVIALTGDNKATGDENASVNTGDAYAATNVVNVANSNIVGKNWVLAVVNVFGDWNGNIAFGKPDLWVGGMAKTKTYPVEPGTWMTYHFTVMNRGDADATNVVVTDSLDLDHVGYRKPASAEAQGPRLMWHIDKIAPGETVELELPAQVKMNTPVGTFPVNNTIHVQSAENDQNTADNTETVSFDVYHAGSILKKGVTYTPDPDLTISKTNDTEGGIMASSTVNYTVTIGNNGGPAYHSILVDDIRNEQGDLINEQTWNLDEIHPNEEITVNYSIFFSASTTPGGYINYAQVHAVGRNESLDPFYGWFADSPVASSTITILGPKPEIVWDPGAIDTPHNNTHPVIEHASAERILDGGATHINQILARDRKTVVAMLTNPFQSPPGSQENTETKGTESTENPPVAEFDSSKVCRLEKSNPVSSAMFALGIGAGNNHTDSGQEAPLDALIYLSLAYLTMYLLYATFMKVAHKRSFHGLDPVEGALALFANGTTVAYIGALFSGITGVLTPLIVIDVALITAALAFHYHGTVEHYFSQTAKALRFTSFL